MLSSLTKFREFDQVSESDLQPMKSRGLAHDHIIVQGTDWLLRVPRGNEIGMSALDYLQLQHAIYDEMAPSGVTPRALGIIGPDNNFPHGAIIVQHIKGRHINDIQDMKAVAKCLGQLHKITADKASGKLDVAARPLASQEFLLKEVFKSSFNNAACGGETQRLLCAERDHVLRRIDDMASEDLPLSLIGGDSHPGNYLIDDNGKAWLVDVEFGQYDVPLVDLADAALPITARLDPDIGITPDFNSRRTFYHGWSMVVGADIANPLRHHVATAERAVRLRTLAWLADWQESRRFEENGRIAPATRANWNDMADHFLQPDNLKYMLLPKAQRRPS